jgi:rSAM/selenodomain-associated transferase 2
MAAVLHSEVDSSRAPAVSVIIPALNEAPIIAAAVQSARQAGADEIIVVDGGSDDGTVEAATAAGARVINASRGRGTQLDRGARESSAEVFAFLHADSTLAPACVHQIREAVAERGAAWGCFQQCISDPRRIFRWLERGNAWRARTRRLVYGDQCLWVVRAAYEAVGGFPHIPLMEDVAMSVRLRKSGSPAILPGPVTLPGRHWARRGVVRQTLRNWTMFGLYRCGVSPERLSRRY